MQVTIPSVGAEPGFVFWRLLLDLDAGHHRARRPLTAPRHHLLDGLGLALEGGLDPAVGCVADPPGDAGGAGLARTGVTEPDTLDPAAHQDATADGHCYKLAVA
jgi:hypothetical protein